MNSKTYSNNSFLQIRNLLDINEFQRAYNLLQDVSDKNGEWYYLAGLAAMKIGYYDEGERYINKAISIDPTNEKYRSMVSKYNSYRNDYNRNSYNYNRRNRDRLDGCCCCCSDGCCECCGDDCCETACHLWCADQCCECCGGDFISCC